MADARQRFALVVLVGLLPWTAVVTGGYWTLLSSLGLFTYSPGSEWSVLLLPEYLDSARALPGYLQSWPIGVLLYASALISAALGLLDREDRRVTAGLLVLVGLTQLHVAVGFAGRPRYTAIPVATITTFVLVWWVYWPDLKGTLFGGRA